MLKEEDDPKIKLAVPLAGKLTNQIKPDGTLLITSDEVQLEVKSQDTRSLQSSDLERSGSRVTELMNKNSLPAKLP